MFGMLPQPRLAVAILASVAGSIVCWVAATPFGLLAPLTALLAYAPRRSLHWLNASLLFALTLSALSACTDLPSSSDRAATWTAVLAVALTIGAVVAANASAPPRAEALQAVRIIESMPAFTWSATADGRVTEVSANTLSFIGHSVSRPQLFHTLENHEWRRILHPDDYQHVLERRRLSLRTGSNYDGEYRLRRSDGAYRWFRSFGAPSRDEGGRILGWYGTMIDIDEQKRAEAALHNRERELSLLVDIVPSHLWRLEPDGAPTFFNKQMSDYLGIAAKEIPGPASRPLQVIADAVHADDAEPFRDTLDRCLGTGERFSMRYRLRRADGVHRWMSSRAEPLRDDRGNIVQWYGICHDIDDQVRAQNALHESEQKLRQLIDAVPALIWSATPAGTPSYINKRLADIVGVGLADLAASDSSCSLADIHPEDRDAVGNALAVSFETGCAFAQIYRQRRSQGDYRWTEGRAEPLRSESGTIIQWYGVCVDIHELVTTQAALRDRERELSQLVDMVPSFLWRLSPDGEPTFFNRRLVDFFGIDIDDIDGIGYARLAAIIEAAVHPEDAAGVRAALHRCLSTGERFSKRYRLRRADGVYRWVEGNAEAMRGDHGQIVQWYGLSHDIDDQLRTEETLRERERSLSQLVETLPAMIDCAGADGEPIYRSRQLRDFLGYDLEDLDHEGQSRLAATLDSGVHPDDLEGVKDRYAHSLSTGEPYARKHRLRRYDGEYRWVETRAAAMRDAAGAIVQWNVICLDIDGEVRAEDELRLARERLARASQAASLAELSASIAHEVNQPLAAVVANSHACQRWLAAEPPNLERAQKTVDRIIRDANGAADVVSRIRSLFKHSGEVRTTAALDSVIAEAVSLMAEEASRRRVRIDVDIEADLPAVSVDRIQIQQVLVNLARNAMEAMEEITGERLLGIRARQTAEMVRTDVCDLGRGVDLPERIFEPFYTTKLSGMGMGLAICRSIVESHGGRLWAEKNRPCGTKLIFTLPIEGRAAS